MNLFDSLADSARGWPERPAIVEGDRTLNYRDLWREVEALRLQLRHLGVRETQGIAVMAGNGRAFVIAVLAAVGCGAVVLPLHPQQKAAELNETLARAPVGAVISDGRCSSLPNGDRRVLTLLDDARLTLTILTSDAAPLVPGTSDAAFVRFTSGTTGAAKGVILTHGGVLERVRAANEGLRLGPEDVVLWVLPMAYHFFVSIVLYLQAGAAIVICPDHLADSILDAATRHRATFLYVAPMQIRMLTAATPPWRLPPSLARVMSVSSFLPPQNARDFHARFGVPVSQGYGIIEVGLPIMNLREAADRPEAIGRPLPSFEVAILDDDLLPMTGGETGQLAVRGPGMFAGYLSPRIPREQALRAGFFLTGDLAHRDADGLITIDGRSKSLINIAGHKVFPEEVSAVIEQHPAVLRARVSTRPHPQLGEVVHAEVQLHAAGSVGVEDLLAFCRRRLSGHKVPASVDFVEEVKTTMSGKVRYG
jgi:long-chain acyl-CoA synthetase